jgi:hypothetical protein
MNIILGELVRHALLMLPLVSLFLIYIVVALLRRVIVGLVRGCGLRRAIWSTLRRLVSAIMGYWRALEIRVLSGREDGG